MRHTSSFIGRLGAAVFFVTVAGAGLGQINITPGGSAVTQNFNSIGGTATAGLPPNWKADKNTTVSLVGSYTAAGTATEQAGGASISSTATNGIYNFTSATASDQAIGGLSSGTASKSVNLYSPKLTNTGASNITSFTITYNVEKYRKGSNAAGFAIQLYYSTNGSTWTSAGSSFKTAFAGGDADNSGYSTVPNVTTAVNQTLTVTVAPSTDVYFAWNYSVASGTTTSNAQALGVDDISITPVGSAPVSPAVTTTAATGVASATATLGGNITTLGSPAPMANGVVYSSTNATPTLGQAGTTTAAATTTATATGAYSVAVTGLSTGTAYNYQAYVTNANGTVYGGVLSFTTLTPTIGVGALTPGGGFSTTEGTASAAQTYTLTGTNLAGNLTVGPLTGYEFSTTGTAGTYAASLSYVPSSGSVSGTVYGRLAASATAAGSPYNGSVANASSGATTQNVAMTGTVAVPTSPAIAVSAAFAGFTYVQGSGPSASQAFSISGSALSPAAGNLNVAATNYEFATSSGGTYSTSLDVPYTGGALASTPLFARLVAGLTAAAYNEDLTLSGGGATSQTAALTGTVTAPLVAPTVSTTAASAITSVSATSGGTVTADGGATVTARGVVYGLGAAPRIGGSGVVQKPDGTPGTGAFSSSLTGLTANTTYFVAAYATNSAGTTYAADQSFTTLASAPTVLLAYNFTAGDTPSTQDANVTGSAFGRVGVTSNAGSGRFNSTGWASTGTVDLGKYITFDFVPNAGYKATLTQLAFVNQRSGTGPTAYEVRSSRRCLRRPHPHRRSGYDSRQHPALGRGLHRHSGRGRHHVPHLCLQQLGRYVQCGRCAADRHGSCRCYAAPLGHAPLRSPFRPSPARWPPPAPTRWAAPTWPPTPRLASAARRLRCWCRSPAGRPLPKPPAPPPTPPAP